MGRNTVLRISRVRLRRLFEQENGNFILAATGARRTVHPVAALTFALAGWVAEWSNAHAWKACLPKGNQGSNPCPSARTSDAISRLTSGGSKSGGFGGT